MSSPSLTTPVQSLLAKIHRGALGIWTTYRRLEGGARARTRPLRAESERLRVQALQVDGDATRRTRACAGCSRCASGCR